MKNRLIVFSILLFPFCLSAQTISGIWTGQLVNDSTHRVQNFELGLSEYRGQMTGYTYTTFIDNDTFYYSIKRIKAERKNGFLVIEDVEMTGNNFPERAAKHVKQTTRFPLINDSTIDMEHGKWSTNKTKVYYSITGTAHIKELENETESDLLSHLQEMKVKTDLAVQNNKKQTGVAKNNAAIEQKENIENTEVSGLGQKHILSVNQQQTIPTKTPDVAAIKQPAKRNKIFLNDTVKTRPNTKEEQEIASYASSEVKQSSSVEKLQPKQEEKKSTPVATTIAANNHAQNTKPANQKQEIVTNKNNGVNKLPEQNKQTITATKTNPPTSISTTAVNTEKNSSSKIISTVSVNLPVETEKKTLEKTKALPSIVAERKNEKIKEVYFDSDSLVLSLYDNGIIDGDTVSVFLNGENIISKQKLKESAIKKTIYITPQMPDTLQLLLFAENLGTIPPNTGLLTVRDGENIYQVRFSADLQTNASILLRRRKL